MFTPAEQRYSSCSQCECLPLPHSRSRPRDDNMRDDYFIYEHHRRSQTIQVGISQQHQLLLQIHQQFSWRSCQRRHRNTWWRRWCNKGEYPPKIVNGPDFDYFKHGKDPSDKKINRYKFTTLHHGNLYCHRTINGRSGEAFNLQRKTFYFIQVATRCLNLQQRRHPGTCHKYPERNKSFHNVPWAEQAPKAIWHGNEQHYEPQVQWWLICSITAMY